MPFGPRELFTASATIRAAIMFACCASLPLERDEPSFKIRTGIPEISEANFNQSSKSTFGTVENALQYKFICKVEAFREATNAFTLQTNFNINFSNFFTELRKNL
jgi:hypothetical protein